MMMVKNPTTQTTQTNSDPAADQRGALPEHAVAEERDRGDDPMVDIERLGARFLEESTESGRSPAGRRDHLPAGEPIDEIVDDLDPV
jgi:hypothetical protein